MARIDYTAGNDAYVQPEGDRNVHHDHWLGAGDDRIALYRGFAVGGPGNDRIEQLTYAAEPWIRAGVAYWDSPTGVRAHLGEGWVEDGWGTRDTLVGIDHITTSGHDDWLHGNDRDNWFTPNGGTDSIFGAGGIDTVAPWFQAPDSFRLPRLEEVSIRVTPDGRTATIRSVVGRPFTITMTDVERIELLDDTLDANGNPLRVIVYTADFLRPQDIAEQALVAGGSARWNAAQPLGTPAALTYSFVTLPPSGGVGATGFRAFTPAEQQLVRDLLARTASFSGLTFTEVTDLGSGGGGQLRFGASAQPATRGTAWLPGQAGDNAGDVWMDVDSMAGLAPGSEGYAALLHEIGHALGLRHLRNHDPADNFAVQARVQDDRAVNSVMSDRYSADGLFRADWGPLDVLALRHLYGSRDVAAGDTVYRLGARESGGQTTIVDSGGSDTLDASALAAGVQLDLGDGRLSSAGVTAAGFNGVENLAIVAGTQIEHAVGTAFDDVLLGNALDNTLDGGLGNDWIDGGAGTDTAVFPGPRTDYIVSTAFGKVFVAGRDGRAGFDTLLGVERLRFADRTVVLAAAALGADSSHVVDEDVALAATLPDPSDSLRSAVSYTLVAQPAHGSATLTRDGALAYQPQRDFWGTDAVTYEMRSAAGANLYVAYVQVLPVNDAGPVPREGSYLAQAGAAFHGLLPRASDADGDPLTYSLIADATQGRVSVAADGSFIYAAGGRDIGDDRFTYGVSDSMGGSSQQTVTITRASVFQLFEGTAGDDDLRPMPTSDGYSLRAGNDRVDGGVGNDMFDGGPGIDTARYGGPRANYTLTRAATHWEVVDRSGADGNDKLVAMERLQFGDRGVALDLDGNAGVVARVLRGVFGSAALAAPEFAGAGLRLVDGGVGEADLVAAALAISPLAAASHRDFVAGLYRNATGSTIDATLLAAATALLDSGAFTKNSLALLVVQHEVNAASADLVGLAASGLEYLLPG